MGLLQTFRMRRRAWTAQRTTPVAASAANVGAYACIEGVARAIAEPLSAPFTSEPSVFFETSKAGEYNYEEEREHSTAAFFVVSYDESVVLVEPTVAAHSLEWVDVLGVEERRWKQACIAPGDHVRVFGLVDETPAVTRGVYRAEATTIRRIRGTVEEPLVLARAKGFAS